VNRPNGKTQSSGEISVERRGIVDRAREGWIRSLIDLSRRNNLLFFRPLKTGTVDFSEGDPLMIAELLAGETVALARLLPDADDARVAARAKEIRRRAVANLEEKGLQTLFIAFGMATWPTEDGARPPESPVLLIPVSVEVKGREGRTVTFRRAGDIQVNLVLLHVLQVEHGCEVTSESLLEASGGENADGAFDPAAVFARLTQLAAGIPGFAVTPRVVLGNFSFQKMAMVKDLRELGAEMAQHDMIAAIAGDTTARRAICAARSDIDPRDLDLRPPQEEFLVKDADSSQQRVVAAVLASQDGVIDGPPGTGKSQTITNLIATLAARGRRVLFVAEKRAALEVVLRRLEEVGLGHLALDMHGADVSRREVMQQVAFSLNLIREAVPVDLSNIDRRLEDRRARLNQHVSRMWLKRAPARLSVYEIQGRLLRLSAEANVSTRWRGASLDHFDAEAAAAVQMLLREAGGFGGLFLRDDPSPWTGTTLPDGAAVQGAIDCVGSIAKTYWPGVRRSLAAITETTGLPAPGSLKEAEALVLLLEDVAGTLELYQEAIFQQDLNSMAAALAPAGRGLLFATWAWCSNVQFRKARRLARLLHRDRRVLVARLLTEVTMAANQLRRWRSLAPFPSTPSRVREVQNARNLLKALLGDLDKLTRYLGRGNLRELPIASFERLLDNLAEDTSTPYRLPRLYEIERELDQHGVGPLIGELRTRKLDRSAWPQAFEHAWLYSCLDRARSEDPALAGFNGQTHQQFVEEFCRLDREWLKLAAARIRRAHAVRAITVMNENPQQAFLVQHEAAKTTRHLPLRKLLAQAPDVLTVVRPCWMASPLSVSQLIPAGRMYFDVVIFDEASQVLPEDAICSIVRAPQAVVAGDQRQLPPTSFFVAGEDEEEDIGEEEPPPTVGFESVLDVMTGFLQPLWTLEWHYRSRDEALIAFSNKHIYKGSLITFAGPGGPPAVTRELVPSIPDQDGQEESAPLEVKRVVELVLQHAAERPKERLGVIALGIKHARRVEAAIEEALRSRPDLDEFFDQTHHERFFVKNLERVQGDERDAIILTIGAGKDRTGRVDYRQFGPLNAEGGERRLNVAVTRARRRMTLVSSFSHHDLDPDRSRQGVKLLRLYLEYAATNGRHLGEEGPTPISLNPFELDVHDALTAKGLDLIPQWGFSRYRIDLVARHPRRLGQFVLAIECDGASYHATPTARDRDRLRQQHLEGLGWRFHRIWSTDWFMRREEEISRALEAFRRAVDDADSSPVVDAGADPPQPDAPNLQTTGPAHGMLAMKRGPRPPVPRREKIEQYTFTELVKLVAWIKSDGRLRTNDEIVEEMIQELGFQRRGNKIEAAIRRAIL